MSGDAPPPSTTPKGESPPESHRRCELCGGIVLERHCKILCLNCGYQRDCSDP